MTVGSNNIEVVEVTATMWSSFVEGSPQASLFVSPEFLRDTGSSASFLLALRRGLPVAGSILAAHKQGQQWFQHHSLVLSDEEHLRAQRGSFAHTVAAGELFRAAIGASPFGCSFSFHPSIIDVRALNWMLDEAGHRYAWQARFSGHIDLPSSRIRGTLARLLRQGSVLEFETTATEDSSVLMEVLGQTQIPQVIEDLDWIEETAKRLITRKMAKVVVAQSVSDRQTRAASLVVNWRDTAHVMFGGVCGNSPKRRYVGPVCDDFLIRHATEDGIRIVDLMGMEGRPRAEYKSGWVSRLVCWLELDWGTG